MIVGNGMIAGIFKPLFQDDEGVVIFASGVSNSSTARSADFQREEALLRSTRDQHPDARLIYFSTTSIHDPSLAGNAYIQHKLRMEALLSSHDAPSLICRTSNIVGHSENPHTLMNHLVGKVHRGEPIDLWEGAMRNLLDIKDLFFAMTRCLKHEVLQGSGTIHVFNPDSHSIREIVSAVESHLGKKAEVHIVLNRGTNYEIPGRELLPDIFGQSYSAFGENYLSHLLASYYPLPIHTHPQVNHETQAS